VTFDQAVEFIEIKRKEDAPVATFKGEPVTQGKGRFGPFLKYKSFFVNIPKRIDPDNITQEEMFELIEKKLEKEANRYIKNWESEKISVENARWGPIIKYKKKVIKLPRKKDGEKMQPEDLVDVELDQVKKWIEEVQPGAFKKKAPAKKKKAAAKKK
jgi:DNA topoisomerase-1